MDDNERIIEGIYVLQTLLPELLGSKGSRVAHKLTRILEQIEPHDDVAVNQILEIVNQFPVTRDWMHHYLEQDTTNNLTDEDVSSDERDSVQSGIIIDRAYVKAGLNYYCAVCDFRWSKLFARHIPPNCPKLKAPLGNDGCRAECLNSSESE